MKSKLMGMMSIVMVLFSVAALASNGVGITDPDEYVAKRLQIVNDYNTAMTKYVAQTTTVAGQDKASSQDQANGNQAIKQPDQAAAVQAENLQGTLCNCYDTKDPNNSNASNFLYNHQQARIKRINPPCLCQVENDALNVSPQVKAVSFQPTVFVKSTDTTQPAAPASKWHIQYN